MSSTQNKAFTQCVYALAPSARDLMEARAAQQAAAGQVKVAQLHAEAAAAAATERAGSASAAEAAYHRAEAALAAAMETAQARTVP